MEVQVSAFLLLRSAWGRGLALWLASGFLTLTFSIQGHPMEDPVEQGQITSAGQAGPGKGRSEEGEGPCIFPPQGSLRERGRGSPHRSLVGAGCPLFHLQFTLSRGPMTCASQPWHTTGPTAHRCPDGVC